MLDAQFHSYRFNTRPTLPTSRWLNWYARPRQMQKRTDRKENFLDKLYKVCEEAKKLLTQRK